MLYFLSLLTFSGCDALQSKLTEIENYANEFVSVGFYLGAEEIDNSLVEASNLNLDDLTAVEMFLVTASASQDLNSNPVSRADVYLLSPLNNMTPVLEGAPGQYSANVTNGLIYDENETALFDIEYTDIAHSISVDVPPMPTFSLNPSQPQNAPLSIQFSNQSYENTLALVINVETGEIVYDNRPSTPQEMYELTHPQGILLNEAEADIDSIEIPGSTFADVGIYVVAVAGIMSSRTDQMDNINTALSGLIAGKFNIEAVCVPDCPSN